MDIIPEGPIAVIRDLKNEGLSVTVHDNSDIYSRFQATLSCIPKYDPITQINSPITSCFNEEKTFQPDQISYPTQPHDHVDQKNFCNIYQEGFAKDNFEEKYSDLEKPVIYLHAENGGHLFRDNLSQFKGHFDDYNCNGKGFEGNFPKKESWTFRSANRSFSPNQSCPPNRSISPNSSSPIRSRSISIHSRLFCADRGPRATKNDVNSFSFQNKCGGLVTRPLCSEFPPQRDAPDKGLVANENSKFATTLRKYTDRGKCACPDSHRYIAERISTYVRTKKVNKSSCQPMKRGQKKLKDKKFGGGVGKATKFTQTYARKYNAQAAMSRQIVRDSIKSEFRIQGEEKFKEQYDYLKGDSDNKISMSQRYGRNLEVRYLLDLLKCIKKRMRTLCHPNSQSDTLTGVCPGCKHAHKQLQEQIEAEVKVWTRILPIQPQEEAKEYQIPNNVTDNMTRELINTLTCLKIRFKNNDFNAYAKKEISSFISNLPAKLPIDKENTTKLFETLANKLADKLSNMDTASYKTKEQKMVEKPNDDKEASIIDLEELAKKVVSKLVALDFKCLKDLNKSKSSLENKISDIISDLRIKLSFHDRNKVFKNSLELFSECINSFYPKHDKSVLESVKDEYKKDLDIYLNKSDHNHNVSIKENSDVSIIRVNFVTTDSKLKENLLAETECENKVFIKSLTRKISNDLLDKNATNTTESIYANHTNTRPATKTSVTDDLIFKDSNNDKLSINLKLDEVPNEKSQEIMDELRKVSSVNIKKNSNDSINSKDEQSVKSQSHSETKRNSSKSSLGPTKSTSFKIEHFQKNILDQVESLLKRYTKPDQTAEINSVNSITNDFINKVNEICVDLDNENRELKELRLRDEIARYMNNISLKSDTSKEILLGQFLRSLEKNVTLEDKKSNGEGSKTLVTTTALYREISAAIKCWINDFQIQMNGEQKETVIKEMAKELYDDITLRRKYKQTYENGYPKVKEDDVCLKYNVYKLVNKILDLNDLAKIIPKIPVLVNKLQDIEGGDVLSKEIDTDASTSRDINELVEKLCDQLFCSLNTSHNPVEIDRMKRNLTNKTVHELKSLHDDFEIVNDDFLYSSALNEVLDNILGSLWTSHGTDRSKDQFKCKLTYILSGYKSKRFNEGATNIVSYKQKLRNAIENVILSQDGIRRVRNKENYATIELFKESLVDLYLNMVFNTGKRQSETKVNFAKEMNQLVSYIREFTGMTDIDFDKLKIDLELALPKVPRPNRDVIISELNKLRYREAVTEWLNKFTLKNDSQEQKLERLQQITLLVKRIFDLNKQKSNLPEDRFFKSMKSAVSVFWKKLRKDPNLTSQTNGLVDQLYKQICNLVDTKLDDIKLPTPIQSPLQSKLSVEERALLQRIRERAKNNNSENSDYPNNDDKNSDFAEAQTVDDNPLPHIYLKAQHNSIREYYIDPKSSNVLNFDVNPLSFPTFVSTVPCCGTGPKSTACFPGTRLPPHSQRQAREVHEPYRRPNYVDINLPGRLTTRYNYTTNDDNDKTESGLEVNIGDGEYADDYTEINNQNRKNQYSNQIIRLHDSGSSAHIYGNDISNIGGNLRPEKARGRFKKMMENSNAHYKKDCPWCPNANYYKICPKCYAMECPYPSKLYFNHN